MALTLPAEPLRPMVCVPRALDKPIASLAASHNRAWLNAKFTRSCHRGFDRFFACFLDRFLDPSDANTPAAHAPRGTRWFRKQAGTAASADMALRPPGPAAENR